jgi:hypothetical protein
LLRDKADLLEGPDRLSKCIALLISDFDDESIPRLLVENLFPGVIDSVHGDFRDLRLNLIESAEINHILRFLDASCVRSS